MTPFVFQSSTVAIPWFPNTIEAQTVQQTIVPDRNTLTSFQKSDAVVPVRNQRWRRAQHHPVAPWQLQGTRLRDEQRTKPITSVNLWRTLELRHVSNGLNKINGKVDKCFACDQPWQTVLKQWARPHCPEQISLSQRMPSAKGSFTNPDDQILRFQWARPHCWTFWTFIDSRMSYIYIWWTLAFWCQWWSLLYTTHVWNRSRNPVVGCTQLNPIQAAKKCANSQWTT